MGSRRKLLLLLLLCCVFASFVSAQTVSITFLDDWGEQTSRVLENGRALLRVIDPGADVSPGPDSVNVTLDSTVYMDSGFTGLVETGDSTGVFEGEMDLTTDFYQDYLDDQDLLFTVAATYPPLDTVTASYNGATASAEAAPSLTDLLLDGSGLSPAAFAPGERVRVQVRDRWADLHAGQDTTVATLTTSGGDSEPLLLTETGGRTGVFETVLRLSGGAPAQQDGRIQAAAGDTLSVTHADRNGFSSSSDTAGVAAVSVRFIDRREGLPTEIYVEASEVVIRIVDAAANTDPGAFDSVAATLYRSSDVEPLTVEETGTDTGVFEGRMRLRTNSPAQGNGYLEPNILTDPPATGQLGVAYGGTMMDIARFVQSVTRLLDEDGGDASSVALGETVLVRVEAANGLDGGAPDSVRVQVRSLTTGDEETVFLWETGGQSWLFEGGIRPVPGAAVPGDGQLQAQPGEILEAVHHDYYNVPRSQDEAAVVRSKVRFVDAEGEPVSLLLESGTARLKVLDLLSSGLTTAGIASYLAQDSETVDLEDSAASPGLFAGSIAMTLGYQTPGNGTLQTSMGSYPLNHPDTVTATANGASAEAITAPAVLELVDEQGEPVEAVTAGTPMRARLVSHRANSSPSTPDTGYATLRSTAGGDMEYVTLVETGPDTSVFLGTVPSLLTQAPGDPNGLLTLRARDSVEITYNPPPYFGYEMEQTVDHIEIVPVLVELVDGQGNGVSTYLFGETVHVRVSEPEANADSGAAETVTAQVRAWRRTDDRPDLETAVLTETAPDSGVFEGQVATDVFFYASTPTWYDGLLQVPFAAPADSAPSTVTATRGEASDSALVKHSVIRFTDAAGNDVERARAGSALHIRLLQPSGDSSPAPNTQTVWIRTRTGSPQDMDSVLLTETGGGTGLFVGSFPTANAPASPWNGVLEGGAGTVAEVYVEDYGTLGSFDLLHLHQDPSHAPAALEDAASTSEDAPVTIPVLANDDDLDGDTLSVTAVTQPGYGSVGIDPSGTVTYTPPLNFHGTDSFGYTVSDPDGLTATAFVWVTVHPVNDPPVAADDTATTRQGVSVVVPVLDNDTDPDGDTLSIAWLGIDGNGTWAANPDGTLTYTPNVSFTGTDTYTYGVRDTGSPYLTDEATVTVTVTPNIPPGAADDTVATNEDTPVTLDVRLNDTDSEGDPLTVTSVSQPNRGSAAINADGTVTYTPTADHSGADLFLYTLSDGHGGTDTALVWVTVTPVNDVPDAVMDFKTTSEDTATTIAVLSNDTDRDGDTLTVTSITQPAKGTAVLNADKTVTYTPNLNTNGSDSFSYTITDGNGGSDTAAVSITVSPVNDPPVAVNDTVTVAENGTVTFAVIGNDTDPENSTLRVTAVTQGAHGTVTIMAGYQLRYQPAAGYSGPDSFTYTLADPGNLTSVGTVSVTVTPINDPPVAVADAGVTSEDTPVTLSVLANDSDPDSDPLTVVAVTQGAKGAVSTNGTTVTYTPSANSNGLDSFTYTVSDGQGGTATATVTLSVAAVNDAPAPAADTGSTRENVSVILAVLANDTDIEGNPLTVTSTSTPPNGITSRLADDTVLYTPSPNFTGTETFTYTVSDGQGGTGIGQVTVVVGEALERVAVLATNSVALRTGSDVLSGDVIVNQSGAGPFLNGAELSAGGSVTTASGWDVEGDSVTVAAGATISGDVRYNQLTNSGVITGAQTSPLPLPVFSALPPFLAATPGTTNINVSNNGTRTLAAGSYLDLVVGRKATVTLTGGVYHFRSIRVDREAKLYVSAASVIRVQQKLSTKNLTVVGPSPGAAIDASSIVFYVGGINGTGGGLAETPKTVEIGVDNTVSANLYAPNGTIWLQDRTQATGALLGRDIDAGADVQITLDSAFSGGQ